LPPASTSQQPLNSFQANDKTRRLAIDRSRNEGIRERTEGTALLTVGFFSASAWPDGVQSAWISSAMAAGNMVAGNRGRQQAAGSSTRMTTAGARRDKDE
jgi:hypothetical protein